MNPEQQRIKIAEVRGWEVHPKDRFIVIPPNSPHSVQPLSTIPNYLNDLNAMHEAVSSTFRDASIQLEYSRALIQVIKSNSPLGKMFFSDFDLVNATAAQRAEAFLKTLNLWTEE